MGNIALWDAIDQYVKACGGDTSNRTATNARLDAVALVERAAWRAQTQDAISSLADQDVEAMLTVTREAAFQLHSTHGLSEGNQLCVNLAKDAIDRLEAALMHAVKSKPS